MSIGSKLTELRQLRGLNQADFARDISIHPNTLRLYEQDKRSPTVDLVAAIAIRYNVPLVWFFSGGTLEEVPASTHLSGDGAYAYIKKAKARLSAGGGVIPEEEFEDQRYAFIRSRLKTVASSESACVMMEIDGDSMRPTLESGDMVLVDQGRQDLISDGIYAFGEGDVINIKRLQRVYPNVRIVSDNPVRECYPSREVDPSTIRIIGRVIWFGRQLR